MFLLLLNLNVTFSGPSRDASTTTCIWTCALALSHVYYFKTSKTEHLKLVFLVSSLTLAATISLLCLNYESQSSAHVSYFDGYSSWCTGSRMSSLWCIHPGNSETAKVWGGCRAMFIILSAATVRHLKSECSRKQDNISFSSNSIKKTDIPSENRMERVQGVWISLPVYWNFYHEYCLSLPSFQKKTRHNML